MCWPIIDVRSLRARSDIDSFTTAAQICNFRHFSHSLCSVGRPLHAISAHKVFFLLIYKYIEIERNPVEKERRSSRLDEKYGWDEKNKRISTSLMNGMFNTKVKANRSFFFEGEPITISTPNRYHTNANIKIKAAKEWRKNRAIQNL